MSNLQGEYIMQYITTKYLSPTNTKGGRIKASTSYGNESLTIAYDHSLDVEQAHAKAAMMLADKLDWQGEYACGGNDSGYVFALIGHCNVYSTQEVTA
jgi:hypothetical protein